VTPDPRFAAFLKALDETQYLPPDRLRAYQRRLLTKLLEHARRETDFYADRLAPIIRADGTIDWDRWWEIPILTRAEAQKNAAALTARNLPEIAGAVSVTHSSGSTAEPFHYRNTAMQNFASGCANERFFDWHQIEPGALMALIWAMDHPELAAYPHGRRARGWRPRYSDSEAVDLAINTPVAEQVEWLRRSGARYFSTYPTNMREVGLLAAEQGNPLEFAALLTNGEMTSDDTRTAIRSYFGKEPLDRYGSTEIGLIAASCPHSFKRHVMAELVLIEIVGEDGSPAEDGRDGRIVATPFYGLAMPLIRYDMGDWGAFAAEPCACGRSLPVFERIHGRSRNMFRFSDGTRVWPVLQSWIVQKYVPHRRFQVVQIAPDAVEYRYVPTDPALPIDHAGLTEYARAQLHPNVTITPVAVAAIERPESGKIEDYVSLIAD
jgi:phenylacetate-coenzyme A ligase PaaK-like adenylate-forming protein